MAFVDVASTTSSIAFWMAIFLFTRGKLNRIEAIMFSFKMNSENFNEPKMAENMVEAKS